MKKSIKDYYKSMTRVTFYVKNGTFIDKILVSIYNIMLCFAYILFKNDEKRLRDERKQLFKDFYAAI